MAKVAVVKYESQTLPTLVIPQEQI